jgi:hypothetical protein
MKIKREIKSKKAENIRTALIMSAIAVVEDPNFLLCNDIHQSMKEYFDEYLDKLEKHGQ